MRQQFEGSDSIERRYGIGSGESRERFINEVLALPQIKATEIDADFKQTIPEPGNAPLGIRCDSEKRDDETLYEYRSRVKLDQHLQSIIRLGSFAFGIVGAYGKNVPGGGRQFIVMMNAEPWLSTTRPRLIAPIQRDFKVELNGRNHATPELGDEGYSLTVRGTKHGKIALTNKTVAPVDLQYVTADKLPEDQDTPNILMDELNSWAAPPEGVRNVLRRNDRTSGMVSTSRRAWSLGRRAVFA